MQYLIRVSSAANHTTAAPQIGANQNLLYLTFDALQMRNQDPLRPNDDQFSCL